MKLIILKINKFSGSPIKTQKSLTHFGGFKKIFS